MSNQGGRPLKFKSVEDLQKRIDHYFAMCDPHMEEVTEWVEARNKDGTLLKDEHGLNYLVEVTHKIMTPEEKYSITGLALALDTTRRTLLDYEAGNYDSDDLKEDDLELQFSHTIKRAKARIEHEVQKGLNTNAPTGTIFNLKNNFDSWKDKTEQDITSGGDKINPYQGLNEDQLRKLAGK